MTAAIPIEQAVEALSGSSRRTRHMAAARLYDAVQENPQALLPYVYQIIDGLNRPEAHTRWIILDVLSCLQSVDPAVCDDAVQGAENALFDEDSGPLRLAAMRFLCRFGSTDAQRSDLVWPLIEEGIQCYHGDLEFYDMMDAVVEFSAGNISDEVAGKLASRMEFDAQNAKGSLAHRAKKIIENTQKG